MRLAIDTGGTFTDLVVDDPALGMSLYKSPTTPHDPVEGVLDVLGLAAADRAQERAELLASCDTVIHATTRALNAILTGGVARTGLLVTEGHEDVLVLREGGRADAFDFTYEYPQPFVPRALTFGLPERIGAGGEVVIPLEEEAVVGVAEQLAVAQVEAVGVCLLWSIAEPAHENLVAAVLDRELPGVPVTLSHQVNPAIREYRRASATAIDASLRPIMEGYLRSLEERLQDAGFAGRLLVVSSTGGLIDAGDIAAEPIHTLNSGPAAAPVAGRHYAQRATPESDVIVADAGGTSFDVSLVRAGRIARTREAWIGPRFRGWMTGFGSVDVRSTGAGGGSIAWVDGAGLLRVGPQSAGSRPGPVAYGAGGRFATVTDAAVVLGYLDSSGYLEGTATLDAEAARRAIAEQVGVPLRLPTDDAAAAVLELATEQMVAEIEEVTVSKGIDPSSAVLVGGGGAIGLTMLALAERLGCRALLPATAAALSAAGAALSDVAREFSTVRFATSANFDFAGVNGVLEQLEERCRTFVAEAGTGATTSRIDFSAEARYPRQVWEIDVPLRSSRIGDAAALEHLTDDFHAEHHAAFSFNEPGSPIELIAWRARAVCEQAPRDTSSVSPSDRQRPTPDRDVWFRGLGRARTQVRRLRDLQAGQILEGPAIVETGLTSVVLRPRDRARMLPDHALELVAR